MAVQADDLGSEQTLEKILEPTSAIRENGSGTTKDKIILPGNRTHQRMQMHMTHFKGVHVKCVM